MRGLPFCVLLVACAACGKTDARREAPTVSAASASTASETATVSVPPVLTAPPVLGPPPATTVALTNTDGEATAAPPATALPKGFADLAKATTIDIHQEGGAIGVSAHALLVRTGTTFAVNAKIGTWLGESIVDPTIPSRSEGDERCVCSVTASCKCEYDPEFVYRRTATIRASTVDRFLSMVARRKLHATQKFGRNPKRSWEYAHVIVHVPGAQPIHLWFQSPDELWRVSGAVLEADAKAPAVYGTMLPNDLHRELHGAYGAITDEIPLIDWVSKVRFPHAK